jgi:hypothetical protein
MQTASLKRSAGLLWIAACAVSAWSAPILSVSGNGRDIFATSSREFGQNFGLVQVGTTATQTFLIHNRGNQTLNITLPVTFNADANYAVIVQPAASVAAGTSTPLTIQFTPQQTGLLAGHILKIFSNDASSPMQFGILGTGVDALPPRTDVAVQFFGAPITTCKDGQCAIKGKLLVTNFGDTVSTLSNCLLRVNNPAYPAGIHQTNTPIFFTDVGPLKAAKPGKPFKFKKVRFKAEIPSTPFQLFAVTDPVPDADQLLESNFANNLAFIDVSP